MTPQPSRSARQALILDLYNAARNLPEVEQQAFVEECTDDSEVRREVLRFVRAKTVTLLDRKPRLDTDTLHPGDTVAGRYDVIRRLGQGGMGVVYEVLDNTMGEKRALKVICAESEASEDSRLRFLREVRTAQRVAHPNVCRIFDIGFDPPKGIPVENESDRLLFFTMELLEGQTLAERISERPLDTRTTLGIIRQVAAALKAAHDHDVIHRDIKPSNIMLAPEHDGTIRAVVMDFGLARCLKDEEDAQLTRSGWAPGTPAYMAPEQALGMYTRATDVYALGIVLYEMLTGRLPFAPGGSLAEHTPLPPSRYVPGLDPQWETVILKCLASDPSRRYQDPSELIAALAPDEPLHTSHALDPAYAKTAALEWMPPPPISASPALWWKLTARQRLAGVSVLVVAAVAILWFLVYPREAAAEDRYVAVLPFRVVDDSTGADLLAVGLTDSISARLFQWQNVRMPSTAAVERVGNLPIKRAARELGAKVIIHGIIQSNGGQVQVTLNIEDVAADKVLRRQVVSGTRSRYLELEDQVYSTVVSALDLQSGRNKPRKDLRAASTNPEAADLYWKARQTMSKQSTTQEVQEAIGFYEQSVRLDPTFARARAYLSDAYVVLYRSSKDKIHADRAVYAAEEARRLDDDLADSHFALGYAYSVIGQIPAAISETRRALELAPNSAEGHRRLGRIYQDSGDKDSALEAFQRAVDLNPHDWNTQLQFARAYMNYGEIENAAQHYRRVTEQVPERAEGFQGLASAYLRMGDFARSEAAYKKALSIQERPANYSGLGLAYYLQGRYADAIRMCQKAIALSPKQELYYGNLGDAYRSSGKLAEARVAYRQAIALAHADLTTNPRSASSLGSLALYYAKLGEIGQGLDYIGRARGVDPKNVDLQYNEALVRTIAGQPEEAVKVLEQAIKGGYSWKMAAADPDLRPLRNDPQFRALEPLTERARRSN